MKLHIICASSNVLKDPFSWGIERSGLKGGKEGIYILN